MSTEGDTGRVGEELLDALAAEATTTVQESSGSTASGDFESWIASVGLNVTKSHTNAEGVRIFELASCPFNPAHDKGSAALGLLPSGARFFKCHHASCGSKKWKDVTDLLGGLDRASPTKPNQGASRKPVIVRMSDVQPEDVRWLWHPYLPQGKIVLATGDPSSGKTYFFLWVCARVTRGEPFWAAQGNRAADNVVYMTAEDGLADTLRPRLDKANADAQRVYVIKGSQLTDGVTTGRVVPITLHDVEVLDEALGDLSPRLAIIDPVQAFLGAEVNANDMTAVRAVLMRLEGLAQKHACTMVLIRHVTKASTSRAIHRGLGTMDFTAAARSELMFGMEPETKQRAMVHVKSNLAQLGPSVGYEIDDLGLRVTGVSELTAADILGSEFSARGTAEEAAEFLRDQLGSGPRPTEEIERAAKASGISHKSLKKARTQLGIVPTRLSKPGGMRGEGEWVLSLPGHGRGGEVQGGPSPVQGAPAGAGPLERVDHVLEEEDLREGVQGVPRDLLNPSGSDGRRPVITNLLKDLLGD